MLLHSQLLLRNRSAINISLKELKIQYTLATSEYGIVELAEWRNIQVVVKRLRVETLPKQSEHSIFTRELFAWMYEITIESLFAHRFIRDAAHDNCVSMYGIVDEDNFLGFVAEYCQHGSMYLNLT